MRLSWGPSLSNGLLGDTIKLGAQERDTTLEKKIPLVLDTF